MKPQAYYSQCPSCGRETSVSPAEGEVDVLIEEAGAICLFHLLTTRAEAWVSLRPDRSRYTLVGALIVEEPHARVFSQWMHGEIPCLSIRAPSEMA